MKPYRRLLVVLSVTLLLSIILPSCHNRDEPPPVEPPVTNEWDIDTQGIPRFVTTNYIELAKIHKISMFRSGVGHSYTDDVESCRSMKHYFLPKPGINWADVSLFSPVSGAVSRIEEGWAGHQIHITSQDYPAFVFIIFHVNLSDPLNFGDTVSIGQPLGTHIGDRTMSDIAVAVTTPYNRRLISYLQVLTDAAFTAYATHGLTSPEAAIIPRSDRDGAPLTCDGETFTTDSTLPDWFAFDG